MARPNDRVFFAFAAVAGALVVVGAILPTWIIGLEAAVGAGDEQEAYDFNRTLRAIAYWQPGALAFPLGGVLLVVVGLLGVVRARSRSFLVLAAAAVSTALFVQTLRTIDYVRDADQVGVYSCEQPRLEDCIGFLAPAIRDLRADILRMDIAREREFLAPGRSEFRTGGRVGWTLTGWTIALFAFVAWFRAAFLVTGRTWLSVGIVGAIGFVVLAYLVLNALENLE